MAKEKPQSELKRLFDEQSKALEDEVFGGLSLAERARFETKSKRINALAIELAASAAKAAQRGQWNKESETDTPQAGSRQTYRSREKDSTDPSATSRRKRKKAKDRSDQKDSGGGD
ncbi:MAG: hypothetical protein WCC37_11560 [Candidatus Sulfotelmatobacter sp.]